MGTDREHQQREFKAESRRLRRQLNAENLNAGHRGLVWINAVGAGALVTWLQSAWDKPSMTTLLGWLIAGTAVLLLGVVIASSIFWLRYRNAFDPRSTRIGESPWWRWTQRFTIASVVCFLVGMALAITGAIRALTCA